MAIGKAGAYATVEAPKVDFGEIAVNAQKIQQMDLERLKDMIPKQKEVKPQKPIEFNVGEKSGSYAWDKSALTYVQNNISEFADLDSKIQKGVATTDEMVRHSTLKNSVSDLAKTATAIKTSGNKLLEITGKTSKAFQPMFDASHNFYANEGQSSIVLPDGSFQNFKTNPDQSLVLDYKGKPVTSMFIDNYGNVKDRWTQGEINSGAITNIPLATDLNKVATEIGNNIGKNTTQTDNGITKILYTGLNKTQIDSAKSQIDVLLNNYTTLADLATQVDSNRFPEARHKDDYSDEDKKYIASKVWGIVSGTTDKSVIKNVDQSAIDRQKDKTGFVISSIDRVNLVDNFKNKFGKDVKYTGNPSDYNPNPIGLTKIKMLLTPGLGGYVPQNVLYNHKTGKIEVQGIRVSKTAMKMALKKAGVATFEEMTQDQQEFALSSFGMPNETNNFVRQPSAAMLNEVLRQTGYKNESELRKALGGTGVSAKSNTKELTVAEKMRQAAGK